MKAPAFAYFRPSTLGEALDCLQSIAGAKPIAGGQTLGPMLNLRVAKPEALVDLTRLKDLKTFKENAGSITYGACLTHANFEDGLAPCAARGFMAKVARGIAYRAVRTRGTLGGSLAHADPAADWLTALLALDTNVTLSSRSGKRSLPLSLFVKGPLAADIRPDEILTAVIVEKPGPEDRFGYAKICRKTGEFAEATGAIRHFADGRVRLVSGGGDRLPVIIGSGAELITGGLIDKERFFALGLSSDPYDSALHAAALQRALDESFAQ
jgi:aerobic carbon-monoxide dehydrogenase medium subunit